MSRSYRTVRRVIFCLMAIALMPSGSFVIAQQQPIGHLIPIGGYSDIVTPNTADVRAAPTRASTPVRPTHTPTPTPTMAQTLASASTAAPMPTLTPTATATATSIPTAVPFGTSATGEVLPNVPITIGAALLLFVIVLVAGRRRK